MNDVNKKIKQIIKAPETAEELYYKLKANGIEIVNVFGNKEISMSEILKIPSG